MLAGGIKEEKGKKKRGAKSGKGKREEKEGGAGDTYPPLRGR